MQAAIRPYGTAMRPYATAGIALVGAGIIAVSPIAPPVPKLHLPAISDGRVALSAFVNPIAQWVEVLTDSGNSLAGLGQIVASDPLPIITALIQNQTADINTITGAIGQGVGQTVGTLAAIPQTLITAANQLAAGQPNAAVQTIWNGIALPGVFAIITPLLGTYPVFQQTVDNFAKVVDAVGTSLLGVGLSVLGPVQSVVNQFGSDTQAFADAIGKGDLGTAVSAIVNMPATLTNALLNGTPGTPGLLTPGTNAFDSGPIGALLRLRDTIAQALGAPSAKWSPRPRRTSRPFRPRRPRRWSCPAPRHQRHFRAPPRRLPSQGVPRTLLSRPTPPQPTRPRQRIRRPPASRRPRRTVRPTTEPMSARPCRSPRVRHILPRRKPRPAGRTAQRRTRVRHATMPQARLAGITRRRPVHSRRRRTAPSRRGSTLTRARVRSGIGQVNPRVSA